MAPINLPRLLIAGTNSGCGKTTVTAALLQAWKKENVSVAAYKCGPDYIDPMFHCRITGRASANLDGQFLDKKGMRQIFGSHMEGQALALIEGVMGYYDGRGDSDRASSYEVARNLETPVLLVVRPGGNGLSAAAMIQGYQNFRQPSMIAGVILNGLREGMYSYYKKLIERETGLKVYGFLPERAEAVFESRHLGLVAAEEQNNLEDRLKLLGDLAQKHIDLKGLEALAKTGKALEWGKAFEDFKEIGRVRLAVAKDKAFCFYYEDNLECLRRLGAEIVFFSPLSDVRLPENIHGLYLGGGYPELWAEELAKNQSMLRSVREMVKKGLPVIAECGGYMYLSQSLQDKQGRRWPMAGVTAGRCRMTERLAPFGYVEINSEKDSLLGKAGTTVRAHEFHYSEMEGEEGQLHIQKSDRRRWRGGVAQGTLYAAYPHLYFYGSRELAENFVRAMEDMKNVH